MWKPKWRLEGHEPDYRFSLANERTFLAWIRTALALLAGGIALEQFARDLGPRGVVVGVSIGLATFSAVLCGAAYRHWRNNEIAMRHAQPLPGTIAIPLIALLSLAVSAVLAALLLFR
jgi:putative membrane protein